jgi:hypothetical protein
MANDQQHYLQQVAAMRQQRAQQERQQAYAEAVDDYNRNLAERQTIEQQASMCDPADRNFLTEDWHLADGLVQESEQRIRQLTPPPPDPKAVEYLQRRQPFIQKCGQRATQAIDLAHQHLAR